MRLNSRHSEAARERIRVANLIDTLQSHADGEIELTKERIRSIEILLNKALSNAPTLKEISGPDGGEQEHKVTVRFVGD